MPTDLLAEQSLASLASKSGESPALAQATKFIQIMAQSPAITEVARLSKFMAQSPALAQAAKFSQIMAQSPAITEAARLTRLMAQSPVVLEAARLALRVSENSRVYNGAAHVGKLILDTPGAIDAIHELQAIDYLDLQPSAVNIELESAQTKESLADGPYEALLGDEIGRLLVGDLVAPTGDSELVGPDEAVVLAALCCFVLLTALRGIHAELLLKEMANEIANFLLFALRVVGYFAGTEEGTGALAIATFWAVRRSRSTEP